MRTRNASGGAAVALKKPAAAPRWLRPLLLTLAAILLFSVFSGEIRDTDIWLHLKTGQHTWETRALTVPDPFSYTSGMTATGYAGEESTRYFNLTHEWLSQVLMYLLYGLGGFPALVTTRAMLLMVFCGLAGWIAFHRSRDFYISLAAALAAGGVAYHFQQSRPFLVTFVCLALTMAILETGRRLWLLPPIFLVWANCHGGFFMGWLVLGAYAAEALILRIQKRTAPNQRSFWLTLAGSVLASGVNPNGFRVIRILSLYRSSGIQSDNLEWQRPMFWEPGIYSFLLFGSLLVLLLAWRRTRPVDWVLYLGFAAVSLMAVRNVIFMGLIGPVLMAGYVRKWRALPAVAVTLAAAALIVYDVAPAAAAGNVFALRAAQWQLPSGAADFIQAHQIRDRMFNGYETGGYLVWRLWPLQRDFIDPRGLSEEAYADYKRLLVSTDRANTEKLLRKYRIEMIVLEGFDYLAGQPYPLVVETARTAGPEWKLVHADATSVIFMRHPPAGVQSLNGLRALLPSLEQQCEEHVRHDPLRPRCARGLGELYAFEANPVRAEQWMAYYLGRRTEPDPEAERVYQSLRVTSLNHEALALEEKGELTRAEPLFREALGLAEKALGPEHADTAGTLNNLAGLLEAEGDYSAAEPLYRRALAIAEKTMGPADPRLALALENIAGLLEAKGDYAGAEPLYRRALMLAEKALGPDDPATQNIRQELAAMLEKNPAQ
jgi:tetratricopeptide (TPR) repeat protein